MLIIIVEKFLIKSDGFLEFEKNIDLNNKLKIVTEDNISKFYCNNSSIYQINNEIITINKDFYLYNYFKDNFDTHIKLVNNLLYFKHGSIFAEELIIDSTKNYFLVLNINFGFTIYYRSNFKLFDLTSYIKILDEVKNKIIEINKEMYDSIKQIKTNLFDNNELIVNNMQKINESKINGSEIQKINGSEDQNKILKFFIDYYKKLIILFVLFLTFIIYNKLKPKKIKKQ